MRMWRPSWISDRHEFSPFRSRSCAVATEQFSAQIDKRFGKRCRKFILKMAAVAAILDFKLATLCLLDAPMLLIEFELNWIIVFRGDVQNMNSQHFTHINV